MGLVRVRMLRNVSRPLENGVEVLHEIDRRYLVSLEAALFLASFEAIAVEEASDEDEEALEHALDMVRTERLAKADESEHAQRAQLEAAGSSRVADLRTAKLDEDAVAAAGSSRVADLRTAKLDEDAVAAAGVPLEQRQAAAPDPAPSRTKLVASVVTFDDSEER